MIKYLNQAHFFNVLDYISYDIFWWPVYLSNLSSLTQICELMSFNPNIVTVSFTPKMLSQIDQFPPSSYLLAPRMSLERGLELILLVLWGCEKGRILVIILIEQINFNFVISILEIYLWYIIHVCFKYLIYKPDYAL